MNGKMKYLYKLLWDVILFTFSLAICHKDDRKVNIPMYIILFAIQLEMPQDIRNQSI